jgi:CBS domain-containing protein
MTEHPPTVTPATPLHDAARILFEQKVDALPVVENGKLVGVITTATSCAPSSIRTSLREIDGVGSSDADVRLVEVMRRPEFYPDRPD